MAILFLVNRYNTLCWAAFYLANTWLTFYDETLNSCKIVLSLELTSNLISLAVWAVFAALRVYSLNNNSRLALLSLGLGLVPFVTNTFLIAEQLSSHIFFQRNVCAPEFDSVGAVWNILAAITRTSSILCDVVVLYVTLSNTCAYRREKYSQIKPRIMDLLVRDGTPLLLALNCVQLALWITDKFQDFSSITIVISSVVISRFILTLREIYFSSTRPTFIRTQYSPPSQVSTVHFTWIEAEGESIEMRSRHTHIIVNTTLDDIAEVEQRLGSVYRDQGGQNHDRWSTSGPSSKIIPDPILRALVSIGSEHDLLE
ncbi:hypothetical protein CERSUDRAFT_89375 [Gelatoporia subvermispora B]|uniref:Uncharacterized protein n=1 Tax=Ceriporiopsis subvermispora (strain B) TaxID=914234 RepID=M2P778_CERS8|nr:hypothetical protein CERSUDRAFT_89375 [Gelatoporia subvermispora B]